MTSLQGKKERTRAGAYSKDSPNYEPMSKSKYVILFVEKN